MRRSISLSRFLLGNISFIVVPLLLASALSLWTIDRQARKSFAELSSLSASLVSSRFDEFFARPHEAAYRIAAVLGRGDLYPRSKLEVYLEEILEEFPYIDRVQIIGPDDRVKAIVPPDSSMIGVSRRGERIYETVRRAKGLSWSESYISTLNNKPALTFGLRAGGETILCDLKLDWVGDYAAALHVYSAPGVEVRITDGNGIYVSNLERDRVSRRERMIDFVDLKKQAGAPVIRTIKDGEALWLVTSSRIAEPDWYVFVLYPASVFSDTLIRGYAQLLLLLAAVAIPGLILWRHRFRLVSVALGAISTGAERVARGDYGELKDFGTTIEDFRRVGESLNAMVVAIGRRERILLDRERGFSESLERIDLAVVSVDKAGAINYVNPFFLALTGYSQERLEGSFLVDLMLPGASGSPFADVLSGESLRSLERCPLRCADGSARLVDWSIVSTLDSEGRLAGAMGIGNDVTQNVRHQELIAASLREKEVLLREVHHRVKNNLQIILSLLQLQLDETENSLVSRALGVSADRILSIALVHETIYGSENFADLDFGDYAVALASHILSRPEASRLRLEPELDMLRLDVAEAVPCGLFVNEAVQFVLARIGTLQPGRREALRLSIRRKDGLALLGLSCVVGRDAVPALAPAREAEEVLLRALAAQLHGELSLRLDGGISIDLVFRPRSDNTRSN